MYNMRRECRRAVGRSHCDVRRDSRGKTRHAQTVASGRNAVLVKSDVCVHVYVCVCAEIDSDSHASKTLEAQRGNTYRP